MSRYTATLRNHHYTFPSLRELMAKASPPRSGDNLAGVAAFNSRERTAAQTILADVPLARFLEEPLIPYETDEVTRLILDGFDRAAFSAISDLTVGQFREWLLAYETTGQNISRLSAGLMPEMVAAASKICRNQDLILISAKCPVISRFRNTLGLPGRLAVRLQPNHPTDEPKGIAAAILDGLFYGCGDAVIGINPATDNVVVTRALLDITAELIQRFEIPTQSCVLAHVTTTIKAIEAGAPVDLVFQSIAGTETANRSFGVNLKLLDEAHQAVLSLKRGTVGDQCMYFETGQGSCLSAGAHHGVDQQTLEARAYAVARKFRPLLVNSVVGFIGPEYLYDGKQIIRAGLEDHFCGKLLGLPMGVDVCYTNHSEADQDDMDTLLTLLGAAGVNYVMGVPGADDIMLSYQSTSFHDSQYLRQLLKRRPAPEFEEWLQRMAIATDHLQLLPVTPAHRLLAAAASEPIASDGRDGRNRGVTQDPWSPLRQHTAARIALGRAGGSLPTCELLNFSFDHAQARDAVYAELDLDQLQSSLAGLNLPVVLVETLAKDRMTYLRRPDSGRRLDEASRERLKALAPAPAAGFDIAIIVADGLSAQAAQRIAPALLAALVPMLRGEGCRIAPIAIARHARVALQDDIGSTLGARSSLILLGERPGLHAPVSLGAYFVYDPKPGTTDERRNCVSNIRDTGLPPVAAAQTLSYLITQSLHRQISGVELKDEREPLIGAPDIGQRLGLP